MYTIGKPNLTHAHDNAYTFPNNPQTHYVNKNRTRELQSVTTLTGPVSNVPTLHFVAHEEIEEIRTGDDNRSKRVVAGPY